MHAVAKAALKNRRKLFNVVARAFARTKHIILARTQISHANVYLGDLFLKKKQRKWGGKNGDNKDTILHFFLQCHVPQAKKKKKIFGLACCVQLLLRAPTKSSNWDTDRRVFAQGNPVQRVFCSFTRPLTCLKCHTKVAQKKKKRKKCDIKISKNAKNRDILRFTLEKIQKFDFWFIFLKVSKS